MTEYCGYTAPLIIIRVFPSFFSLWMENLRTEGVVWCMIIKSYETMLWFWPWRFQFCQVVMCTSIAGLLVWTRESHHTRWLCENNSNYKTTWQLQGICFALWCAQKALSYKHESSVSLLPCKTNWFNSGNNVHFRSVVHVYPKNHYQALTWSQVCTLDVQLRLHTSCVSADTEYRDIFFYTKCKCQEQDEVEPPK